MTTAQGEQAFGQPWNRYPRPQMRRDSFLCLNGTWDLTVGEEHFSITVPFCPESKLSGIGRHFPEGAELRYQRHFHLPEDFRDGRILLHIGAADQQAAVYVNGQLAGTHEGGYDPICLDVTAQIRTENDLCIVCRDDLRDKSFPYGKQTLTPGGMWYTPVSGIWQTVWLERVPETYIYSLRIQNRGAAVILDIGQDLPGRVTVPELGIFPLEQGRAVIRPENPHLWTPEDPYLYACTVQAGEDRVESYFAIRWLEVKKVGTYPRLCLNGKPYFFHGLLDQGYWPDGLFTPADPSCYEEDIRAVKELGYNTLRKHIKAEPEEFYYQCDRLGMVVWQDLVNNGPYRFLHDTALPTLGIQTARDDRWNWDGEIRRRFQEAGAALVERVGNHPSVCLWTIFNEGWGQFDSDGQYGWLRFLDDTRFIDTASGWFRGGRSDVDSRHVYFRKVKLKADGEKPLVLSEFGGKTYAVPGHMYDPDKRYGYGSCQSIEELNEKVAALYREEVLPLIPKGLCAAIYTQLSDVEQEINGVRTYDRRVCKLKKETMLPIAKAIRKEICKK